MDEAKYTLDDQSAALASKGALLLTVRVETAEQADELLRWMYARDKPMKAQLLEIAWDKVAVPKKQAEALAGWRQRGPVEREVRRG